MNALKDLEIARIASERRSPLPQSYARSSWPSAVPGDELDACRFEGGAHVPQKVIARHTPVSLKISDRRYANLACLSKVVLRPVQKRPCSSTLGGGKRSLDRVKRYERKFNVRG